MQLHFTKGEDLIIDIANKSMLKTWGKNDRVLGMNLGCMPELKGQPFIDILKNIFETGKTYSATEDEVFLERNERAPGIYL